MKILNILPAMVLTFGQANQTCLQAYENRPKPGPGIFNGNMTEPYPKGSRGSRRHPLYTRSVMPSPSNQHFSLI